MSPEHALAAICAEIRRARYGKELSEPARHDAHLAIRELGYRTGWNHAMGHVERLLRELGVDVIG